MVKNFGFKISRRKDFNRKSYVGQSLDFKTKLDFILQKNKTRRFTCIFHKLVLILCTCTAELIYFYMKIKK